MLSGPQKWLTAVLICTGLALMVTRLLLWSEESVPGGDSVWKLTLSVSVNAVNEKHVIRIATPFDTASARVISQSFVHSGFRINRLSKPQKGARELVATTTVKAPLTLFCEYLVQVSPVRKWKDTSLSARIIKDDDQRDSYLKSETDIAVDSDVVLGVLNQIKQGAGDRDIVIEDVYQFVSNEIIVIEKLTDSSSDSALSQLRTNSVGVVNAMVALLRASNVPARIVTGLVLKEDLEAGLIYWVEAHRDDSWYVYDPVKGFADELPANYIPLKYSGEPVVYSLDNSNVDLDIEILPAVAPIGMLKKDRGSWLQIFDFSRLSLATQVILGLLLMLPFGALINTFFRQVLGVRTYGTFTPALLALAVMYTDWITVTVIVATVVVVGIGGRSLMPDTLSRVPRLTVVFTLVALGMGLGVSIMNYFDWDNSAQLILLPIVILTSLVDSVYKVADEKGVETSIKRLLWTLCVAFCCLLLFSIEYVSRATVMFPEMHLITLAVILIIAEYRGKKLSENPAWVWLSEQNVKKLKTDKIEK